MNSVEKLADLGNAWSQQGPLAAQNLIKARGILAQLVEARGEALPSEAEKEIADLVRQLTAACQHVDAQFVVARNTSGEISRQSQLSQLSDLVARLNSWCSMRKLGLMERADFLQQWLLALGVPATSRDPEVAYNLGAFPRELAACRSWERHLLLPRRISSLAEVGSKLGVRAIILSRMARVGAMERSLPMVHLAAGLDSIAGPAGMRLPIGIAHTDFQPQSAVAIHPDCFDAIWFHRKPWAEWVRRDGPHLLSAIGELARRFHFLLFTTSDELPERHDLLAPLFEFQLAGEYLSDPEPIRFIVAQRRSTTVAGTLFRCTDMRIHDPSWQGCEDLSLGAPRFPWSKPNSFLRTRRLMVGPGQAARTFLSRTSPPGSTQAHDREIGSWQLIGGAAPEIPSLRQAGADAIGQHLILDLAARQIRLPMPPFDKRDQACLVRSALRVLRTLRSRGLHWNFLRVANFSLAADHASILSTEFIAAEEWEDPLEAFLWFLHDLGKDKILWHDWPIEPFPITEKEKIPGEWQELAELALRSRSIDGLLASPSLQQAWFDIPG